MSEKELMQAVIDLATLRGWRHYHTFDARKSDPGFPDLVLVRSIPDGQGGLATRVLAVELKRLGKRPTAAQQSWLDDLAAGGIETAVWDELAWSDGTVERALR
jgi:hypothetical protein